MTTSPVRSGSQASRPALRTLLTVLMLLLAAPFAQAELPDEVLPWLQKLATVHATTSYQGELVYLQDGSMTTIGVVHHAGPEGGEERLFTLDGQPREVIRGIDRLLCKTAPGQSMEMPLDASSGSANQRFTRLDELAESYRISLGGQQRIAARNTQRIELMPRGDYRYGYRLWLDTNTGLPLKTEVIGTDGEVIEQAMFTKINYLDDVAASSTAGIDNSAGNAAPTVAASTPFPPSRWRAEQLPAGFRLSTQRYINNQPNSTAPVTEQLVYSDGMTTVSVFVEPLAPGDAGFNGITHRGTIALYGRTDGNHQLTVIGEVPESTLRRIGDGLRRQQPTP